MTTAVGSDLLEMAPDVEAENDSGEYVRITFGGVVEFFSKIWLLVAGLWTFYFLYNLIDSRSVIVTLEQELGAPLPEPGLMPRGIANELFGAFCGHGFRGESVNHTFANALMLAIGGFATYAVGLPLLLANVARMPKSQTAKRISAAVVAIAAVQVLLAIGFMDTIDIVTYFGD